MTEPNSRRRLADHRRDRPGPLRRACSPGSGSCRSTGGEKLAVAAQRQRDRIVHGARRCGARSYDRNGTALARDRAGHVARRRPPAARRPPNGRRSRSNLGRAAGQDARGDRPAHRQHAVRVVRAGAGGEGRRPGDRGRTSWSTADLYPEDVGDPHRRAALPERLPRPPTSSATWARSTTTSSRRAPGRGLPSHATPSARPASSRCSNRSCAASRARTRSRSTTRAARSNVVDGEAARGRARRAAHRRPRRRSTSPRSRCTQGMDGARSAGRPRQRQLLHGQRRRGRGARRADRSGRGDGVEPDLRPQRLHHGQLRPVLHTDPNNARCINRALNAYAPGSTFKTITSIAMLQSGLIRDGAETPGRTYPEGCFDVRQRRASAATPVTAVLGTVDLPRALTVSSDVYFYTSATSSGTPTATRARPRRAAPAATSRATS